MRALRWHRGWLLVALATAGCSDAWGDPGPPGAPPTYGSADPDAGAEERAPSRGAATGIPAFDVPPPSAERSPPPTREEWKSAPLALDVRITDPSCEARRLREYYRLSCKFAQAIGLVSGPRDEIELGCPKETKEFDFCEEAWVVFPVRRNDRRVFQFFTWSKWGPTPDSVATAQWIEGDAAPMVTVQGIRWGF